MPELAQAFWTHWLVVWQKLDTKTRYGQAQLSDPEEIRCRWLVSDQAAVSQDSTQESYPRSVLVAKPVALGSYVYGPCKIKDLPTNPTHFEVIGVQRTPDIKGRHPTYRITLQKVSNQREL